MSKNAKSADFNRFDIKIPYFGPPHTFLKSRDSVRHVIIIAGPASPIAGICRTCGVGAVVEKICYLVEYSLDNFEHGFTNVFHHADKLKSDNTLNPRYICINCAKLLKASNVSGYKRLKTEKRFLAKFLDSPSDCSHSNCQHIVTSFEDLKKIWSRASYHNQCQFMVLLAQDIKLKIRTDIESNISQLNIHLMKLLYFPN